MEDKLVKADCRYVLDVLNYDMTDIFLSMGVDTTGGTFCFPEQKETDLNTEINVLSRLKKDFGLPISDDYLYEKFGVEKPKDYKLLKAETNQKIQTPVVPTPVEPKEPKPKKTWKGNRRTHSKAEKGLHGMAEKFFVHAPEQDGAALKW